MDDNSEAQEDEILAFHSIYEEEEIFSFDINNRTGKFFIKFRSPETKFFDLNFETENVRIQVEHLLPIQLSFEFPSDYPSINPPKFAISCHWLSHSDITRLCKNLDDLWDQNDNQSVLFTWISFLSNEIFDFLNIKDNELNIIDNLEEEKEATNNQIIDKQVIKLPFSHMLAKNYNNDQIELKFQSTYFNCHVCFNDKLGKECMKFHKCDHVFCSECMKGYFESQIKSGDYKKLICPYNKCETEALQTQVLNLVGMDLFNRYDGLLLKDSLNSMEDITYCPRTQCQTPVIPEGTLAQCNLCNYAFCALCRQGYHGVEACKIPNSEFVEIYNAYTNGTDEERVEYNKKYGEKRIKTVIEEYTSMKLIRETSKQCPECISWMQKLDGCNKMTCTKCNCYFCWLCLKKLTRNDPYSHFNDLSSECIGKLFEGTWVNEDQNDFENDNNIENNDDNNEENLAIAIGQLDLDENDFIYEEDEGENDQSDDFIVFLH